MTRIMTVLGPVEASRLGITLPHEHLFIDLSCLWHEPKDRARRFVVDAPVQSVAREILSLDPYHCRDNLLLSCDKAAALELEAYKKLGGQAVVDLSTRSIGPYPEKLRDLSSKSGVNIIAGTGFYTKRAHPDYVSSTNEEDLAEQMVKELEEGFSGSGICAGVIGEIGTSSPIHEDEKKVLRAVALAHAASGVGINVHLAIFSQEGHAVLDILESAGVDPAFVALSHLDEYPDITHHRSLAERGCFIEYDCFGSEVHFEEDCLSEPSDDERIEALLQLLEAGYLRQILLSQDVCTKMQLHKYGGHGYDHILKNIVPALRRRGVGDSAIQEMLVNNPARFLCGRK